MSRDYSYRNLTTRGSNRPTWAGETPARPPLVPRPRTKKQADNNTLATKKYVKRIVAQDNEDKFFITTLNQNVAGNTILPVMTITQGDGDSGQRDGDEINLREIQMRGRIIQDPNSGSLFSYIRVVLFQWHSNGTPTSGSVLLLNPATGFIDPQSFFNKDNEQLFKVLYDRTHAMNGLIASLPTGNQAQWFQKKIYKMNKKVSFLAASSTVMTNQLYLLVTTDIAINGPFVSIAFRVDYTDS